MNDRVAELTERLREKLRGIAWCDHEAGICNGACQIIEEIEIIDGLERVARCDDPDLRYSAWLCLGALRHGEIRLESADVWLAELQSALAPVADDDQAS